MFKIKNLIVLPVTALILTSGCNIFNSSQKAEPPKDAKTAVIKKDAKAKKDVKTADVKTKAEKDTKTAAVKKDAKAKKDVKAKKDIKTPVAKKDVKAKKTEKVEKVSKPELAPAKNQATNYARKDSKYTKKDMIGLGFITPMQFPSEATEVSGFRFSAIYTYNEAANGLDCGFICASGTGGTRGLQAGVIMNKTAGSVNGLSISLINIAETEMNGIQLGGYNEAGSVSQNNGAANYETSCGIQMGAANVTNSIFKGLQLGLFNISNSVFKGWQVGALNLYEPPSDVFDDFQTKEFNEEKKKRSCVQVGVLNFNPNGIFPITLLVNW